MYSNIRWNNKVITTKLIIKGIFTLHDNKDKAQKGTQTKLGYDHKNQWYLKTRVFLWPSDWVSLHPSCSCPIGPNGTSLWSNIQVLLFFLTPVKERQALQKASVSGTSQGETRSHRRWTVMPSSWCSRDDGENAQCVCMSLSCLISANNYQWAINQSGFMWFQVV